MIKDNITIRSMKKSDIASITNNLLKQGWPSNQEKFESYFLKQQTKEKYVFIADNQNDILGYVTLEPLSMYGPFKDMSIPMIVDLNVFRIYQNQGIGSLLMDACEKIAFTLSNQVCLGVGLHAGYGNAQRLYIKRGYIPDGSGVWYHDHLATPYQIVENDDELNLFLIKNKV